MFLFKIELPPQTVYYIIIALIQIPIFTGLGAYVVSQRPRHHVSWAFALICATAVVGLSSSFFLIGRSDLTPADSPLAMRIRWMVSPLFAAALYHIYSYYYPESWRRFVRSSVLFIYATAGALAVLTFSTTWVVSGLSFPEDAIHPNMVPGFLFPFMAGIEALILVLSAGLLIYTYVTSTSTLRRRHIRELLVPLIPLLIMPFLILPSIFSEDQTYWITRLSYVFLLVAILIYARNILRQGHFVGRSQSMKQLVIIMVFSLATIASFIPLFLVEAWLYDYSPIRLPLLLTLITIIFISAQPALGKFVLRQMRRLQDPHISQQEVAAVDITAKLEQVQNPQDIYQSLLTYACESLSVSTGFLAFLDSEGSQFVVKTTYKATAVSAGQSLPLSTSSLNLNYPNLLATIAPYLQEKPEWQETLLVCPIFEKDGPFIGLLALGERHKQQPYQQGEISYCQEICRRLAQVHHMARMIQEQSSLLERAQAQTDEIIELQTQLEKPPPQPSPALKIFAFGPLRIERENSKSGPATWSSSKEKSMLGYLLWCGPRGATREELSTALWPDYDDKQASNVFHVTMHKLRQTLDPDRSRNSPSYISHTNGRYQLNADLPIWIDVVQFEQLMESSEPDDWRAAVSLYHGPYLEYLTDKIPDGIQFTQRHYEALYESGLRRLINRLPPEEAYGYMETLLTLVPTDEIANEKLARYYLAQGRGDLARSLIAQWRKALAEMSIPPTPDVLAFWREIEGNGGSSTPN